MSPWNVFFEILWFMMLVAWIWLFITLLADLFSDPETSGWGKAAWALFLIVLPWIGCLTYLIVRGKSMSERAERRVHPPEPVYQAPYVQPESTWSGSGPASELGRLVDLRDRGAITNEDYELAKAQVLAPAGAPAAPPVQRDRSTTRTS